MTVKTLANATVKDVARAVKQLTKQDPQIKTAVQEGIGHTTKTKRILKSFKDEMGDIFSHKGRMPENELARIKMDNPDIDPKIMPLKEAMKRLIYSNVIESPVAKDFSTYA